MHVGAGAGVCFETASIEADDGFCAPAGETEEQGEAHGLGGLKFQEGGFLEGIAGIHGPGDCGAVADCGLDGAGSVKDGGESVGRGGVPEVLDVVGPGMAGVMLAAAVVVRVHVIHGAAVLDARGFAGVVALGLVGGGEVAEGFQVGGHGSGHAVERGVFAAVCPEQVAGDGQEEFVGEHFFGDAAGFNGLSRAGVASAAVFIASEHAAGDLSIGEAHVGPIFVSGLEVAGQVGLLVEGGGFAEALGHVDVVPIDNAPVPACCVLVDLFGELQEFCFSGAVIEPVEVVDLVAGPHFRPVTDEEPVVGHLHEVVGVAGHEVDDAGVFGLLVVGLEAEEHDHVGPEVVPAAEVGGESGAFLTRAKPAVRLAAIEGGLDPDSGFLDLVGPVEQDRAVLKAFEPVYGFLPSEFTAAVGIEPCVALLFQEAADVGELAVEAVGLELEHALGPTCWADTADWEFDEGGGEERGAVAGVERVGGGGVGAIEDGDRWGRRAGEEGCG